MSQRDRQRWVLLHVVGIGDVYARTENEVSDAIIRVSRLTIPVCAPHGGGVGIQLNRHPWYAQGAPEMIGLPGFLVVLFRDVSEDLASALDRFWSPIQVATTVPEGRVLPLRNGGPQ